MAIKQYTSICNNFKKIISSTQSNDLYKGRRENKELLNKIELFLSGGKSYSIIIHLLECSRATIVNSFKTVKAIEQIELENWHFT